MRCQHNSLKALEAIDGAQGHTNINSLTIPNKIHAYYIRILIYILEI